MDVDVVAGIADIIKLGFVLGFMAWFWGFGLNACMRLFHIIP